MILIIRISGLVDVSSDVNEALFRMRLRKKYTAVVLHDNVTNRHLLKKVRNYVAFGTITKEDLTMLIEKRGLPVDKKKKIDVKKAVEGFEKSSLLDLGVKPFFRLHPARGGIDTKIHYPIRKGVLGDHKDKINELMRRML
ncbi:MAG: uL30 family ribosomal protein [Nanoarchaeota archaeon]